MNEVPAFTTCCNGYVGLFLTFFDHFCQLYQCKSINQAKIAIAIAKLLYLLN